ncbi:sorbin and SH3 domain-containing protein 2-like [Centruroides vittatus]|uniref:sorbin and SH3 domain-containing protein 2-like n=1 Tax=Centruroides vittatus TaxID=120091 RepID=UPI00350F2C63
MANVPTGPTFKATAADAVWTPGRRREEEAEEKERREEAEEERSPVWRPFGAPPDRLPAFRPVGPDRQRDRLVPAVSLEKMTQKIESDSANGRAAGPSGRVASGSLSGLPQPLSPTVILLQKAREGQIPKGASYIKVTEEENASARKCKGIGPMVQGIPLSLRTEVKEEYASDWYKTMYKSLHKFDKSSDDYVAVKYYKKGNIPHDGGYMSEPEVEKEDYSIKYSTDNYEKRSETMIRDKQIESKNIFLPTSLRSYQEVYKNQPRSITEYEPGHSSISDREERIQKIKYLPPLDQPKPSYVYRDGYESDSTLFRRSGKPSSLDPQQQKLWYRKIQQGSDIPFSGLGKPAPERPKISPHKYQETEVNIHYRSPIRNLEKEYIEEEELRKRQETAVST